MNSCANCGNAGSDVVKLKTCTGCRLVKYCGVECQKAHRRHHKAECRKRASERAGDERSGAAPAQPAPPEWRAEVETRRCGACNRDMEAGGYSTKQWRLKRRRRCKECIAAKRDFDDDAKKKVDRSAEAAREKAKKNKAILLEAQRRDKFEADVLKLISLSDDVPEPPPRDECPICFHTLPPSSQASLYMPCCGQIICRACSSRDVLGGLGPDQFSIFQAQQTLEKGNKATCPFCRTEGAFIRYTSDPDIQDKMQALLEKRVEKEEPMALQALGMLYLEGHSDSVTSDGDFDPENHRGRDRGKAIECFQKAASSGNGDANYQLALICKENYTAPEYVAHLHKAAERGNFEAHRDMAQLAEKQNAVKAAVAHYRVLATSGCDQEALDKLRAWFEKGVIEKDELASIMRAHKRSVDDVMSDDRTYMARVGHYVDENGKRRLSKMYI